ncbi:MAG: CADD family putative folate metabolism protein [Proteobacteria bacterium]|nr:CADD family putative folate metabolism protein [Pseudomonadota bacterium]
MTFIKTLNAELDSWNLLNHPFYKSWNSGDLSRETLQTYAKEYYQHVAAFPRYVSGIHFQCDDLQTRQVLLGNLIEEEQGPENHPELWKQFAKGLGVEASKIEEKAELKETNELVDGYYNLVKSDFATGLGALYAYERQTPEVSKSKIDGLKAHYGVTDDKSLQFFTVHMKADEWHSEECANLIEKLDEDSKQKAKAGALAGAKLLWNFLSGMENHAC